MERTSHLITQPTVAHGQSEVCQTNKQRMTQLLLLLNCCSHSLPTAFTGDCLACQITNILFISRYSQHPISLLTASYHVESVILCHNQSSLLVVLLNAHSKCNLKRLLLCQQTATHALYSTVHVHIHTMHTFSIFN